MPSLNIHLEIAKRLKERLNFNEQQYQKFLLGSILPDINNGFLIEDVSTKIRKEQTHFFQRGQKSYDLFLEKYKNETLKSPVLAGYYYHLYTDYMWNLDFANNYCQNIEKSKENLKKYMFLKISDFEKYNNNFINNQNLDLSFSNVFLTETAKIHEVSLTGSDLEKINKYLNDLAPIDIPQYNFYNDKILDSLLDNTVNNIAEDYNRKKLDYYENMYHQHAQKFLPVEAIIKENNIPQVQEEIISRLGSKSDTILNTPAYLFHGSVGSFDVLQAKESTQAGTKVYATDNPIKAFFFAIFRNSSEARASIKEEIDPNTGEYKAKYVIDERVQNAVSNIINNNPTVTVHVCSGEDFTKKIGRQYILHEWVSKSDTSVKPIDKFQINVKEFLNSLEAQKLIEYKGWNKTKDIETILSAFRSTYPFQIAKGPEATAKIDEYVDYFTATNWAEHTDLVNYLRNDVKKIMFSDLVSGEELLTKEQLADKRIGTINQFIYSTFFDTEDHDKLKISDSKVEKYLQDKLKLQKIQEESQSLTLKKKSNSVQGYVNYLVLILLIGFCCGVVSTITLFIIKSFIVNR